MPMNVSTINKTLLIVLFVTTPLVALMAGITTKCSPAEGGTISSLGGYEYKAIPNSGYVFSHWNMSSPLVEHSPSSNPYDFYSFLMTYGGGDFTLTAYFEKNIDPTWQILYTSTDGNVVTPYVSNFGANIVSNEYKDGRGVITFDGPVTSIGNEAFDCCSSLASITIPEGVTTIGAETFLGCTSLTSITIPSSVISIGDNAFYYCSALTSISLPESLISIGQAAFRDCSSLTSITLPESLTSIGEAAFYYCSALNSITIPEGITSIQNSTFYYCSALTSITLPESLTNIGEWAFRSCSALTSITIPEGVTSIQNSTFFQCSDLTSITLPKSLTSIGEKAFYRCVSLTSITIPESVTSIGEWAFRLCSSLTTITIPSSVTSIGESAFYRCDALTSVTCKATTPPTLGEDVFNNIDNTIPVYVPCGSISAYKAADLWNYFTNFQSSEQFAMAVHSNNDTWGQVSITHPTIPYVGFTATADNSSIRMVYGGTLVGCIPNLQYSYDGQSWKKLEEGTNYNVEKGQTIYMRGHNPNGVSRRFDGYSYFDMKGSFEGSGDIMTLVDSTGATTTAPDYCFYRLFRNCTSLTKAPRLTATTINYQAYVSMFSGCTKLQHIEVDFTAWSSSATESWVSSVAPTGTFVKPTALSASYGSSYIPSGWTVIDKETNDSSTSNVTSGTYECETTLILTATPNDCYQFTKWSDGNTDNPRTIIVEGDVTYTAEFEPIQYTTTVESADESQGSVNVEKLSTTMVDRIFYTSSDGNIVTPYSTTAFGAKIIGNTYQENQGVIVFDEVVTSIGEGAFYDCSSLSSITIGNGITSIESRAFYGCTKLTSMTFEGLTPPTFGVDALYMTNDCPIYVPCGTKGAYVEALNVNNTIDASRVIEQSKYSYSVSAEDVTMGSVVITQKPTCTNPLIFWAYAEYGYTFKQWSDGNTENPRSLSLTQDTAFTAIFEPENCLVTTGTCGNNLTWELSCDYVLTIRGVGAMTNTNSNSTWQAFYNNKIKSVIISEGITSIGYRAFQICQKISSVLIPSTVTIIEPEAFQYCYGLTSVIIPKSVTTIEYCAFLQCGLTSVTIGNGVSSIESRAFYGCTKLTSMTFEGLTPPTFGAEVLYMTNDCPIYVPYGTKEAYVEALNVNNTIDASRVIEINR